MKRVLLALIALLFAPSSALATWSVIAVDRATGRVVIASATCVDRDDQFLMGVQAVVVPGMGVAACQAGVDGTHKNQMLVFEELKKGTDPKRIIEMLSQDPAFQSRQFGILDLQGRSAGHSGLTNGYVSQDVQGQVPGTEIFYSIQGNILRAGYVVPNAVQAFTKTTGTVTDRVMAAMEAADGSGGDSRCNCPPWPTDGTAPAIACDGRTSTVAYILAADPKDTNGDSHNNGKYSVYLTTSQPGPEKGPYQIKPGENLNPVKTLRMRYDAWKKSQHTANNGLPNPLPPPTPPQGRRGRRPESPRTDPGDVADDHRVDRRRHDPGEVHAGRRAGVAAAGVEQRAGRRAKLRADRARHRRGDRHRHGRHPALDAVEYPGVGAIAGRRRSRRAISCRTARGRSARAVRPIADPARPPQGRRIITCSRSTRLIRRSTCPRLANRRR